jgi:hypothetical protein
MIIGNKLILLKILNMSTRERLPVPILACADWSVGRVFSSKDGTTTDTDTVNKLLTRKKKNSTAYIDRTHFRALTFNAKTEIIYGDVIGGGCIFR